MALAVVAQKSPHADHLLTAKDVAERLNVSADCVWDHSSCKTPFLPAIRIASGTLRDRSSAIESFIAERERMSAMRGRTN